MRTWWILGLTVLACGGSDERPVLEPEAPSAAREPSVEDGPRGEEPPSETADVDTEGVEGPEGEAPAVLANVAAGGLTLPEGLSASDLTMLGGELFAVHGGYRRGGLVSRVDPSGDLVSHRGPAQEVRIRTVGTGANAFVAATGAMGAIAVYRKGQWDHRLAPALEGETIGAIAAGAGGVTWVAGKEQALYEWRGGTWDTHPYGSGGTHIIEALMAKDGTLFLIGRHGRVLTYRAGTFRDVQIRDLGSGPFVASWVDEVGGTVWLAEDKRVLELDVNQLKATAYPSKLFFGIDHLDGVRTAQGTLLLITTFGRAAVFDGTDWFELSSDGADGGVIDAQRKVAYLVRSRDHRVVDVKHPFLGTGPGTPMKR